MHTTVLCCENVIKNSDSSRIKAKANSWLILPDKNKNCLVLESKELTDLHNFLIKKYNIKHLFTEFIPHITVDYDFKGFMPVKLPDLDIYLHDIYIKNFYS